MTKKFVGKIAKHYLRKVKPQFAEYDPVMILLEHPESNPESQEYADYMVSNCQQIRVTISREKVNEKDIESAIRAYEKNPVVTGLFVLHPFGSDASLDQKIMYHINPLKDVEGLHPSWMGDLTHYRKTVENQTEPKLIVPCTPKAVMKICERHFHSDFFQEDYQKQEGYLKGHKVVVVNYTHIVGLPLSLMFRNEKATVTPVDENSPPDYLKHLMSQADILVSAVGKPGFKIKAEDVKPNSLVIDVAGDFESDVTLIADYVSNKGVSKVTQATLLNNLNSVHELQKYFKLGGTDPVLTPYARELKIC